MSAWLSAANKTAAPARGQMMAEISRQQTTMMKAWTEAWMQMWMPWVKPTHTKRD